MEGKGMMSSVSVAVSFVVSFMLLAQEGPHDDRPQKIDWPVQAVYTPKGFDDNDVAQFVLVGEFPNTCYSLGGGWAKIYLEYNLILFQYEVFKFNKVCTQVKTPFFKVIDVGILPEGNYKIAHVKNVDRILSVLPVSHARQGGQVDNFLYAPVQSIFLHNDPLGYRRLVTLTGSFSNTCMRFKDEQTTIGRRTETDRVIEILPVVEMIGENCLTQMVPFFKTMEIPESIPSGTYLFHIRTLNGNSINHMDFIRTDLGP